MDLIRQTVYFVDIYLTPLTGRVSSFNVEVGNEYQRLETEKSDLREQLQLLAIELKPEDADVSICLDIALEDVDGIFTNRGMSNIT